MSALDPDDAEIVGRRRSPRELVRKSLVTGAAIVLPLAVTLLVLSFVVNFFSNALSPISRTAVASLPVDNEVIVQAVTVVVLLGVMFVVGFLTEYTEGAEAVGGRFDDFMAAIPGLGSVYTSFNEMSELLLDSDTDSFQDVKLVQYPVEGSYTVAFKTADTPATLESDTGEDEMITLFMPMAPNPVMGGFVIHVSTDRVVDTDMTVEEGIRSIVTSGVAIGDTSPTMRGLSEEQLEELGRIRRVEEGSLPDGTGGADGEGKREQYEAAVAPEFSETPGDIERRSDRPAGGDSTPGDIERRSDRPAGGDSTPGDIERGDGAIGDTGGTPDESRRADERTRGTTSEPPAQRTGRRGGSTGTTGDGADSSEAADTEADDGADEGSEGLFPTDDEEWTEGDDA